MPLKPPTLVVNEIYPCLQGESSYAGCPCVLVRLTGCHLRCRWCDSAYSFYEGERLEVETVLERIRGHNLPSVLVTGGEPLLQKHTPLLVQRLVDEGYRVWVETSGNRPWHTLDERAAAIVDIKCPGSGEAEKNCPELLRHLRPLDEVKFVIADRADYEYARQIIEDYDLGGRIITHLSPVWGEMAFDELAGWILKDRLPARLQIQMHKVIYGKDLRGV